MRTLKRQYLPMKIIHFQGRIPRQTVLEETRKCMKGEESADEAVNAIMQKINLYLAE